MSYLFIYFIIIYYYLSFIVSREQLIEGADASSLSQSRVIVLEESQVRHLHSVFCARDRKRRTRVYLPGTALNRVAAKLKTCLYEDVTKPIVILIAEGNDLCKVRYEELCRGFDMF